MLDSLFLVVTWLGGMLRPSSCTIMAWDSRTVPCAKIEGGDVENGYDENSDTSTLLF